MQISSGFMVLIPIVGVLIALIGLYVRSYISFAKSLTFNYNEGINRLERVLTDIEGILLEFEQIHRKKGPELAPRKIRKMLGCNLYFQSKYSFNNYRESCRLRLVGKNKLIRIICDSIKSSRPEIYGVPTDKLKILRQNCDAYLENPIEVNLAAAIDSVYALMDNYHRQADIGLTMSRYIKDKGFSPW